MNFQFLLNTGMSKLLTSLVWKSFNAACKVAFGTSLMMAAQLPGTQSICTERCFAQLANRNERQMISGPRLTRSSSDFAEAAAAAESNPVQRPRIIAPEDGRTSGLLS